MTQCWPQTGHEAEKGPVCVIGREFIDAKLHEREARHLKQGERYVVEPNVKEGKGGLRDLQSLFWIAKHIYSVEYAADLVDLGVFRAEEFETFVAAEDFLWAVRGHLHLLTGRATEQLTFDMQVRGGRSDGVYRPAGDAALKSSCRTISVTRRQWAT